MVLNKNSYIESNEVIDIKDLVDFLLRKKIILIASALLGFSISALVALTTKRTWQGEFQIVIDSKKSSNLPSDIASSNVDIANFLGLKGGKNESLNTEIEILKSPSVLMPVFEYAKVMKSQQGIETERWIFQDWEKSLKISNIESTSILSVAYNDKTKKDIIPILKQISDEYKRYSKRDRELNFKQGLSYLENQIEKYKEKTLDSRKKVQDYANKYDLGISGIAPNASKDVFILDIENTKLRENEKIRIAELRLKQLEELSSYDEILSFSTIVSNNNLSNFQSTLEKLVEETIRFEAIFTEDSPVLIRLKNERDSLSKFLKNKLKTLLEVAIKDSKSKIESSKRPKDVIMKYKELIRESIRDEKTLSNLENNERFLKLDKARTQNPWEVITEPTLRDIPVAPKRKLIAMQGLFFGLFLGLIYSIYLEKKAGLLFSEKNIQELLKIPKLDTLVLNDNEDLEIAISLLNENISKINSDSKICLFPIGNIKDDSLGIILNKFKNIAKGNKFDLSKNIVDALKNDYLLIIIEKGFAKKKQIINLKRRTQNTSEKIIGWILLK